jgi:hypothetical protein
VVCRIGGKGTRLSKGEIGAKKYGKDRKFLSEKAERNILKNLEKYYKVAVGFVASPNLMIGHKKEARGGTYAGIQ